MREPLRTVRLTPYRKGLGPTFTLRTWDIRQRDWRGQSYIAYELRMHADGTTVVLFAGTDFAGSPLHADDADATIGSLLGFLTLRPGDTDTQYFNDYTPEQIAYCEQHAEALACYCSDRFGEN